MNEGFRAYVNRVAIASSQKDVHITCYFERPVLADDGKTVNIIREEQGVITFAREYAHTFCNALISNLEQNEQDIKRQITKGGKRVTIQKEVKGNES